MRSTMILAATAAVAVCASSAFANETTPTSPTDLVAIANGNGPSTRSGPSEDFESFPLGGFGTVTTVNGWSLGSAWGIEDSSIGGAGGNRALGLNNPSPTAAGSSFFSPAQSPSFGVAALDMRIDAMPTTADNFGLQTQSATTGTTAINTRLIFQNDGTVDVLQVEAGAGVFVEEIFTWTPGEEFQVGVETLADGTLNVYKNAALVFTGTEINSSLGNPNGTADQWVGQIFLGNTAGNGSGIGGAYDATFDNFGTTLRAVPEPASLGLLGLGGLALIRRRR